ncbi:haloacid dehalogenase [Pseudoalteromonas luteoviolacea]|uniref:Haloacid dehalogenase n=1 Tax=Pseudoalteromonas luteoviolacea TaxID=43657 RepID=A0A1C0TNA9_9GAMM|nr:HAD family phosphatase [Pseudoalteromonas luteoviolacea]OCQ20421.1 haloacid dehalogenase [Pseudoalteromonas luteoviolacea]
MGIQALLFDFDGTLVDSETLHYLSWCEVLKPLKVHIEEQTFCNEFSGVPTVKTGQILQQRYSLLKTAQALAEAKNLQFIETAKVHKPVLMPHARDVLSLCAQKFKLALVTGSTTAEAVPVLSYYGLLDLFDCVICKDDVAHPKPNPEPYLQAMQRLNISPDQAIALEDSHTGLLAAVEAGVKTIVIPHKHSKNQDFSRAAWLCDNLESAYKNVITGG